MLLVEYRRRSSAALVLVVVMLASALASTGGVTASLKQADFGSPVASTPSPDAVTFPADDGPHPASIEWWYYTGHLFTETGERYGFEFVVFKGEQRGAVAGYASHFAMTDNKRGTFQYDQRLVLTGGDPLPPANEPGFDLRVGDWRMWGSNGSDRLVASLPDYAIALTLEPNKPPALHDGDGYITYGSG